MSTSFFALQTERLHFDTTTVTFSGAYAGSVSEPRITHGYNKDHRPDLKQLLFGLTRPSGTSRGMSSSGARTW